MIGWLRRLLGAAPLGAVAEVADLAEVANVADVAKLADAAAGADVADVAGPAGAPAAPPAPPALPEIPAAAIDRHFYQLLAGAPAGAHDAALEKTILDEMARLVHDPYGAAALVPRVPAVIPQLLASLRDESLSGADLARQVAQDVVLVAEVIREANSPYYRPAQPVKTIEGALLLLGQNGMRMLLARVAFRPVIGMQGDQNCGHHVRLAAPLVWAESEACALAASTLAGHTQAGHPQANPFDAYLAGLMHNVGLIVAFRVIDQVLPPGARAGVPHAPAFCAALLAQARALSSAVAAEWDFPEAVVAAIAHPRASALGLALALGDRLAKLRVLVDAGVLAPDAASAGLEPALQRLFHQLATKAE